MAVEINDNSIAAGTLVVDNDGIKKYDVLKIPLDINMKNDGGVVKDMEGNIVFSKVVNVSFFVIKDDVSVTGNRGG